MSYKIGSLVEFSYGRLGAQIDGIGLLAELGYHGKHKIIYKNTQYWVPSQHIKLISQRRR